MNILDWIRSRATRSGTLRGALVLGKAVSADVQSLSQVVLMTPVLLPDDAIGLDGDPHLAVGAAADDETLVMRHARGGHHEGEAAVFNRNVRDCSRSSIRRWLPFAPHGSPPARHEWQQQCQPLWYCNCPESGKKFKG